MRNEVAAVACVVLSVALYSTVAVAGGPPLAEAGLDQEVSRGSTVFLDATGSRDPDGGSLAYEWTIRTPSGATVTPECATCARTEFAARETGRYEVTVTVTDDEGRPREDTLYVDVEGSGSQAPVGSGGTDARSSSSPGSRAVSDGALDTTGDRNPMPPIPGGSNDGGSSHVDSGGGVHDGETTSVAFDIDGPVVTPTGTESASTRSEPTSVGPPSGSDPEKESITVEVYGATGDSVSEIARTIDGETIDLSGMTIGEVERKYDVRYKRVTSPGATATYASPENDYWATPDSDYVIGDDEHSETPNSDADDLVVTTGVTSGTGDTASSTGGATGNPTDIGFVSGGSSVSSTAADSDSGADPGASDGSFSSGGSSDSSDDGTTDAGFTSGSDDPASDTGGTSGSGHSSTGGSDHGSTGGSDGSATSDGGSIDTGLGWSIDSGGGSSGGSDRNDTADSAASSSGAGSGLVSGF